MNTLRLAVALGALNLAILVGAAVQTRTAAAQGGEDILRGRALELVDEGGKTRARIDVEPSGEVVFRLLDQQGTIRVKLGAGKNGSGLLIAGQSDPTYVQVLAEGGETTVRLKRQDGRERVIRP